MNVTKRRFGNNLFSDRLLNLVLINTSKKFRLLVKYRITLFSRRTFVLQITIGKTTITTQMIFKILFPFVLIATLFLLISSIVSKDAVFTSINLISVGSTCLSYYFSKQ